MTTLQGCAVHYSTYIHIHLKKFITRIIQRGKGKPQFPTVVKKLSKMVFFYRCVILILLHSPGLQTLNLLYMY